MIPRMDYVNRAKELSDLLHITPKNRISYELLCSRLKCVLERLECTPALEQILRHEPVSYHGVLCSSERDMLIELKLADCEYENGHPASIKPTDLGRTVYDTSISVFGDL